MRQTSKNEKWAIVFLGVVCVYLAWRLVASNGVRAGMPRPTFTSYASALERQRAFDFGLHQELSRSDPAPKLNLLKEIEARPLPRISRNPFEFPAPPRTKPANEAAPTPPAPPPPPPPPPLKALGYTEKKGGTREALVADEQEIYVVHEGDTFASHFRALRISSTTVEVEDVSTHQIIQLPIPQ